MKTAWAVILASAGLIGCAANDRPTVSQLEQGLNFIDVSDPTWGMSAAYVKGDHVVYLETRVGTLKPEFYRMVYEEDSTHEMDMRFVDAQGRTFMVQRGGDDYVDPRWTDEIEASLVNSAPVTPEELERNFALAKEAAGALMAKSPVGFDSHLNEIRMAAEQEVPRQDAALEAKLGPKPAKPEGYSYTYVENPHYMLTRLSSGSTGCFAWICAARHSATRMMKWGGSSYLLIQDACNHGRCWDHSGMGWNCDTYGGWFYSATYINGETNGDRNGAGVAVSGGCGTPYDWSSGDYDHLCNDDAAYELWQARDGSYQTSQGDRYSFVWDNTGNFACNCNNNNDCDGDYNRPNCP